MKMYTINENNTSELIEKMEKIIKCAKMLISNLEETDLSWKKHDEDEFEEYDYRPKRGRYPRF